MKTNISKLVMSIALSFSLLAGGTAALQATPAHATSAAKASKIISTAKKYLGTPYKYGVSTSTTRYFDCSSFTKYVFKKYGTTLPRTSKSQSKVGSYVSKSNLKPGDLVFFYKPIHHVGIYIGNGKMIHTYGKPGVMISSINSGWWSDHYATARRVS
ncbi:C40 family peptidase [Paenibacillus lignilyticus]|uniref:C40 family peptidase n=1 Tax=Paenibacillus lignilyticus TaxID=1172615 RepID=A0ABS5CBD0_9BACL|nr:C40 family peptidase [Paenibacillus lignilyticus]MBP3963308.1 C40 family peptidase [Paenibacillus lignilyticus]